MVEVVIVKTVEVVRAVGGSSKSDDSGSSKSSGVIVVIVMTVEVVRAVGGSSNSDDS